MIYTTSVTGILETKVQCKEMRGIFQRLRVRFEERNIYMDKTLSNELEFRLPGAKLPQAFFNGEHLGVRVLLLLHRPIIVLSVSPIMCIRALMKS